LVDTFRHLERRWLFFYGSWFAINENYFIGRVKRGVNSLKISLFWQKQKTPAWKAFGKQSIPHKNIPTMMKPFASPAAWFLWRNIPPPRVPLQKGLAKAPIEGFSIKQSIRQDINLFLLASLLMSTITCSPSEMVAKMASIAIIKP
jgi:hypothetical protein